jgi:hypothetical protein
MAAFRDTIQSKASATRAGPSDANASALVDALRPIARLLGRAAGKEAISAVPRDTGPRPRTDVSDCDTETSKGSHHGSR